MDKAAIQCDYCITGMICRQPGFLGRNLNPVAPLPPG
ncbi:MAG TPA: hypothetical protein DDY32_15350 [Desulfobulbaceae bacterium]|nr:hypothetical protein [Desulfobulbaceae bacterium]